VIHLLKKKKKTGAGQKGGIRPPYVGFFCLGVFFMAVIFANVIAPYDPQAGDLFNTTIPPVWQEEGSMAHILGTDMLGRDVLSRIIHGSRMSLLISVGCILFYGSIGVTLGLVSGFLGGRTDMAIMSLADLWL